MPKHEQASRHMCMSIHIHMPAVKFQRGSLRIEVADREEKRKKRTTERQRQRKTEEDEVKREEVKEIDKTDS